MEKLFTQGDVNRIFKHIPASTLLNWGKMDVVTWSGESHDGRGVHRLYSRDDLHMVGLVEELTSLNFPLDFIRKYVVKLHFRRRDDAGKKGLLETPGAIYPERNTLAMAGHNCLIIYFTRSWRKDGDWGSMMEPVDRLLDTWEWHAGDPSICDEHEARIMTYVVIRLSEVIEKVEGYISESS